MMYTILDMTDRFLAVDIDGAKKRYKHSVADMARLQLDCPELYESVSAQWANEPLIDDDPKSLKKAEIAAARYAAETAGTTVNGILIDTGRDSQALITGAALAAVIDNGYSLNWKTEAGFIHLSAPEIIAVAQAVRAHVQSCFDREGELVALVDAAQTAEDLDAIDMTWTV